MIKKPIYIFALATLASAGWSFVSFSGSSGTKAAQVQFDIVGGNLEVILTNTSTADVLVPTDVLTAVFFDIKGSTPVFSQVSALLSAGSTVTNGVTPGDQVVGGEWAYRGNLGGTPYNARYGISSSGLGIFGPGDLFPGANLSGPADPDGLQFGIASAGDDSTTHNTGANVPLIKNSVTFLLGSVPTGFKLSDIGRVTFQYGTALDEGHFGGGGGSDPFGEPVVPGPAAVLPFGVGLLAALRKRRS